MAEETKKEVAPRDKRAIDLTNEEKRAMMKMVGLAGLPYPMFKVIRDEQGVAQYVVGGIQSEQEPLIVYSEQPLERVNGELIRSMPTPQAMPVLRDLIAKSSPESDNRLIAVFGDPASGKTFLFKKYASLIHPQGAISVDCGGMNLRELLFRTVIDYGMGVKDQLEKYVTDGLITKTSLDLLESEFPGSVITKDGKSAIDWEAVGRAKKDDKGKFIEERKDAAERAQRILTDIYAKEGIEVKENAFGIKTVPGELIESYLSGRPILLDEFNKAKHGTMDAFQTFLQFVNGEKGFDSITLHNPMATSDTKNDLKSITLRRSDRKLSWIMGISGNDAKDGATTQEIPESTMTRLDPLRIDVPTSQDWEHRISQIWTGLPLVTLYDLFKSTADAKPAEFAEFLVRLRKLGLHTNEVKNIPVREIYFLQNFQTTVRAIKQVAKYYADRLEMSDPESKLYEKPENGSISDEISAHGDKIHVSFRKAIADFNKAIQSTPKVYDAKELSLSLDLDAVFRNASTASIGAIEPAWHRFGENMARVIVEDIANNTKGMPQTCGKLLTLCEHNGITIPEMKEARLSEGFQPLAKLMKYDALRDVGGSDELKSLRSVLVAALKSQNSSLKQADDKIIPLENLGRVLKEITEGEHANANAFVMPNDNLNTVNGTPLVVGQALPIYELDLEDQHDYELADFRTVLAALAVPESANDNLQHIWPSDLRNKTEEAVPDEDKDAFDAIEGKSETGFNMTTLATASADPSNKGINFLWVIEDRELQEIKIIGSEKIGEKLQSELKKNHVEYLLQSDESTVQTINDFLTEGARVRGEQGGIRAGTDAQNVVGTLIKAFSAVCDAGDIIKKGSTLGSIIQSNKARPGVYTSIVKPKALKK